MCSKESIGKMPLFQRITSNTSLFRVFLATSYVKLQDAFAAERNAVGGWKLIGYTVPASNNFSYAGAIGESVTVEISSSLESVGWQANNKVVLNDCTVSSNAGTCFWDVKLSQGANSGQIAYAACLTDNAAPLTANFTAISTPGQTCQVSTSAVGSGS